MKIFLPGASASFSMIARASPSMPFLASISTATRSASPAPLHAAFTMARSSLRFGAKMPGVSMKMICELPCIAMPRTGLRVVCTLGVTIDTLAPTSSFRSVDLPTFGAPTSATKPHRVSVAVSLMFSGPHNHAFTHKQRGGGSLLRVALGRTFALGGLKPRQFDGHLEYGLVVRPAPLCLPIGRRRQAPALRPFLQHGFRIA